MCLPVSGGKGNHYEGGLRVPAIAWWPGTLAPGQVSTHVVSTMDVYPTLVHLAGGQMPTDRYVDGRVIPDVVDGSLRVKEAHRRGEGDGSDVDCGILFFYCNAELMAVRYRQYKIHYRTKRPYSRSELSDNCVGGVPRLDIMTRITCHDLITHDPPLVYDVEVDPGEEYPLPREMLSAPLGEAAALILEHRRSLSNLPEPMLHLKNCHRTLIPCCKPPYCTCGYSVPLRNYYKWSDQ